MVVALALAVALLLLAPEERAVQVSLLLFLVLPSHMLAAVVVLLTGQEEREELEAEVQVLDKARHLRLLVRQIQAAVAAVDTARGRTEAQAAPVP